MTSAGLLHRFSGRILVHPADGFVLVINEVGSAQKKEER